MSHSIELPLVCFGQALDRTQRLTGDVLYKIADDVAREERADDPGPGRVEVVDDANVRATWAGLDDPL